MNKLKADFEKLLELYPELKNGFKLYVEIKSAYKDSEREEFVKLCQTDLFIDFSINDILNPRVPKNQKNLYVSSYDRLSRVFLYALPLQIIRLFKNISIKTLLPEEIELEKKALNILSQPNQDQLLFIFQILIVRV